MTQERQFLAEWSAVGAAVGAVGDWEEVGVRLAREYTAAPRAYHGQGHVLAVLRVLGELCEAVSPAQRLAAFFHDAFYLPELSFNEEASAVMAETYLPTVGVSDEVVVDVAAMIRASADHFPADVAGCEAFLDADLSILGADPDTYDRYSEQIRTEYAHVPLDEYRLGRAQVLRRFVDREDLFFTEIGKHRFEDAARANLRREINTLRSGCV